MISTQVFFPSTIENVSIALLDMFSHIPVVMYDASGVSADQFNVFTTMSPATKAQQNRLENHYFDTSATDTSGYTQVTQV